MVRPSRLDGPDCWFHVMNRGLARRTVFENRRDVRYFLSRIAYSVRRGELEVHAFCIMTTHFHLLVRSPRGALSEGMRRIQNEYVRWFNRGRRRDGPLLRGRFVSRPVRSIRYRETLVRYIDANPVKGGLVPRPDLYPHGSARHHTRLRGPPWLEPSWIEKRMQAVRGNRVSRAEAYESTFGSLGAGLARLVEMRLRCPVDGPDPLDDLLGAAGDSVLAWMRRKARLADGTRIGLPICDAESVERTIESCRKEIGEWSVKNSQKKVDGWCQARAGLMRDLCASSLEEIGRRLAFTTSGVSKALERHRRLVLEDPEYAQQIERLIGESLRRCGWAASVTGGPTGTVGKCS